MPADESSYWRDWFNLAGRDLERVHRCLEARDLEDAAFHLQQALEKYLKGFLLSRGWTLKRHHNLVDLINTASQYLPEVVDFRDLCLEVTEYYTIERYPLFTEFEIDDEDLRNNLNRATQLIDFLVNCTHTIS
jgi:HEPN domain-containing protein